eukprot:5722947-Pyramimonas_sp.AAC.1
MGVETLRPQCEYHIVIATSTDAACDRSATEPNAHASARPCDQEKCFVMAPAIPTALAPKVSSG